MSENAGGPACSPFGYSVNSGRPPAQPSLGRVTADIPRASIDSTCCGWLMAKRTLPLPLLLLLLATCRETLTNTGPPNPQSVAVLTQHNDNTRSGWNANETALTTSNVNVRQFGAVFTLSVDDQVYAQPLVVGHVSVGGGDHNVVYLATVNNTVYAYDGDNGTRYWQRSFTAPGMRPPRTPT